MTASDYKINKARAKTPNPETERINEQHKQLKVEFYEREALREAAGVAFYQRERALEKAAAKA